MKLAIKILMGLLLFAYLCVNAMSFGAGLANGMRSWGQPCQSPIPYALPGYSFACWLTK